MPELMTHQWISSYILEKVPAALLYFDPGTGKTATAIDIMKYHYSSGHRYVVIVPAFLTQNWVTEIKLWWPEATVSVQGHRGKDADPKADVILTSYDRAPKVDGHLRVRRNIIYDEAHYLCGQSERTRYADTLANTAKLHHLYLLTGTPMNNRIGELYNLLFLLDAADNKGFKKEYRNKHTFQQAFCYWKEKRIPGKLFTIKEYYGVRNEKILKLWTGLWFVRFRLAEVIELPDLVMENVHVEGVNDKLQELLAKAWELSPSGLTPETFTGAAVGEHISTAKSLTSLAKVKATVDFCADVRRPAVIFTDHVQTAKDIAKALNYRDTTAVCVTGETPIATRATFVDRFQRGEVDFFVGTIGSCGVGINLTAASTVIMNDYSWVPSRNEQAIARVYRYGQKNKVVVYTLVGGKVDTRIHTTLQEKMKVIKEMDTV
jgi:SNF2 family DNA or RNA helicase